MVWRVTSPSLLVILPWRRLESPPRPTDGRRIEDGIGSVPPEFAAGKVLHECCGGRLRPGAFAVEAAPSVGFGESIGGGAPPRGRIPA